VIILIRFEIILYVKPKLRQQRKFWMRLIVMPPMPVPSICYGGILVSVMSDAKGCYTPIGDTGMPFNGH
jgi:hypothetical protein